MLLRRGKTYYCRVWVPLDLRERLGRNELKKSLQTKDRKQAKAAAVSLKAKTETAFFRMRAGMLTERELEQLSVSILAEFSSQVEAIRTSRDNPLPLMSVFPLGSNDVELLCRTFKYPRSLADIKLVVTDYQNRIDRLQEQRATGVFDLWLRTHASRLVEEKKLDVEQPPPEWFHPDEDQWWKAPPVSFARVCDAIIDGLIEAYRVEIDRVQGRRESAQEAALLARIEAAQPKPKLSELWLAYQKSKLVKGKWGDKTAHKNQDTYDEALKILGDRELTVYSQDAVLDYIATLREKGNGAATITGKVETLSSLFKFALKTPESIDHWKVKGNPFTEMQVQDNTPVNQKKIPYTAEDLHDLLSGLLSIRKLVEPHRYWVPLVALYSGMRQNEICQLRTSDIVVEDGISVFKIRHNPALQQTVKAREERTCPVHPMLKKLRFLEYLEQQRKANQDRLFPTLTYTEGKGWCGKVRNWYNETFQAKHVTDTKAKSFHSFRGTFINWFKQNQAYDSPSDRAVVQSMVGHDGDDSVTSVHYEQRFPAKTQIKMLKKLDYGIAPDLIEKLVKKEY